MATYEIIRSDGSFETVSGTTYGRANSKFGVRRSMDWAGKVWVVDHVASGMRASPPFFGKRGRAAAIAYAKAVAEGPDLTVAVPETKGSDKEFKAVDEFVRNAYKDALSSVGYSVGKQYWSEAK
jgi:hypothetical protein